MGANLSWTNLQGASLRGAVLTRSTLQCANLADTDLRGCNFSLADLSRANLSRATLHATLFAVTNLKRARGLHSCLHRGPSAVDPRTFLKSGNLPTVFLRGCGLPESFIRIVPELLTRSRFHSCFISYSHRDKGFARELYDNLQQHDIRCWLDEKNIDPGEDIAEALEHGIRTSEKVLLCCSKGSLRSWWVDNEIGITFAREQQLSGGRKRKIRVLIPLDLDGYLRSDEWTSGYSTQIRRRLAADFTGWEKDEAKFKAEMERVIKALRADQGAREKAPEGKL